MDGGRIPPPWPRHVVDRGATFQIDVLLYTILGNFGTFFGTLIVLLYTILKKNNRFKSIGGASFREIGQGRTGALDRAILVKVTTVSHLGPICAYTEVERRGPEK